MKIAIVTGASSGMGREAVIQIASRFTRLGEIWVAARRGENLFELQKCVKIPLRIFAMDLAREVSWDTLKADLREYNPRVMILVNAAGYGKSGRVGCGDLGGETGMIRLNCEALCAVTHLVLPYMASHGRILQFASAAGFLPQPGFAIYAATKAFVLSYSRGLNQELKARDIVVTAVCPGPVATEFFATEGMAGEIPFYKKLVMANPQKVVKTALRDSIMGKTVSVYGVTMNVFRVLCKVIPHRFLLKFMNGEDLR